MISIGSPCGKRWEGMPGDERRRWCGDCGKFVHAAAAHTEAELAAMGPFCVYLGEKAAPAPRSRRTVIAGTLLTAIAPLLAQYGKVRVVVTDATGAGVEGATVKIGVHSKTSSAAGAAEFGGLPAGRYEVTVQHSGFSRWRGTFQLSDAGEAVVPARLQIEVLVGDATALVEIDRAAQLSVAVTDPSQRAVADAEVNIRCARGVSGKVRTDHAGIAFITNMPAGECQVDVRAPGFQAWQGQVKLDVDAPARLEAQLSVSAPLTRIAVQPKNPVARFKDWLTSCARR